MKYNLTFYNNNYGFIFYVINSEINMIVRYLGEDIPNVCKVIQNTIDEEVLTFCIEPKDTLISQYTNLTYSEVTTTIKLYKEVYEIQSNIL